MREKFLTGKMFLTAIALFLFAITGCNRADTTSSQSETVIPPVEVSEVGNQVYEPIEAEETPSTVDSISIHDAMRSARTIIEIEMIFVEGGTMVIQGQEISVDSFYISKFVFTCHLHAHTHNWAHERGYLGDLHPVQIMGSGGCLNRLLSWSQAIVFSNYISIIQGLTPVYWLENRMSPILSVREMFIEVFIEPAGMPSLVQWLPFFIDWNADGYRLPTEAEWEFAARGGNNSRGYRYAGSNILAEVMSNFEHSDNRWYIPGQKRPNELGIYDMSGQSPEWVLGPWTEYGNFETMHNPGRMAIFDFAEPFYLIQKGRDHRIWVASPIPEGRIKFQPDSERGGHDSSLMTASVRFVRNSGL